MKRKPTTKSSIRQRTKRQASATPPIKPSKIPRHKLESERQAAARLRIPKTTLHDNIEAGMYARNEEGKWELAHPELALKLAKLRHLELTNKKLESTIEGLREHYVEDVASAFASLVTALRHSVEHVCFRVTSDPALQQKIFESVRAALTLEADNLKRVLGVRDGPVI